MSSAKIIKDSLFYGLVPKLTLFVSVITMPLITPFLTPYDYGISGVLGSYSGLIGAFLPLGLHVHLSNSFFELPRHYNLVWGRVLGLMFVSALFCLVVNFLLLTFIIPMTFSVKLVLLCAFASIPLLYSPNRILAEHLFPLVQKPQPLVLTNLVGSILAIIISFIMIYFFRLGYWGLVVPSVFSGLFCNILFVKFVWKDYHIRPIIEHKVKRIMWMLKVGLPLVPHGLGFMFLASSANIVMSQLHVSYDEIGLYNHGYTMGGYAVIVTSALQTAIAPQIQRAYRSGDYIGYRQLYYLCQSVALISSICICIWLPEIYSFLIRNDELRQSCSIASLMCFSNVVMAFYGFLSAPVFIKKNTLQLLWLVFVPGILNFALCLIFIPLFGYRAAIYSTIIAYWSQLLIPFFVKYYNQQAKIWMGSLMRIVWILIILLIGLISGQYFSILALSFKLLLTLVIVLAFLFVYKKKRLYEVI